MPIELPYWAEEIRPHQIRALQDILAEYNRGNNIVVLDAPTGAGKTLIGELTRQSLNMRTVYLCSSLSLQTQFAKDFPHAAVLRGRSNYATADSPSQFPQLTAADCVKSRESTPACYSCDPDESPSPESLHCRWCHPVKQCPYESAKAMAIRSDLVCTNTSYFLHEANYVGSIPLGRQLIIVDEADTLEDVLLSFVEVTISKRRALELGITAPEKKTVESAWVEWALYAEVHLKEVAKSGRFSGTSIDAIRQQKGLNNLIRSIERLNHPNTGLSAGGWVYTGYDKGDISFKPIEVSHVATDYLWKHSPLWLLMSATCISFPVLMATLGVN
jgi:Rad3-related DNA helicase